VGLHPGLEECIRSKRFDSGCILSCDAF